MAGIVGVRSSGRRGRWADARRRISTCQRVGRYCFANVNRYRHDLLIDVDTHRYRYGFAFLLLACIVGANVYGFVIFYGGGYLTIWHGNRSHLRDVFARLDGRIFAGRWPGRFSARGDSD